MGYNKEENSRRSRTRRERAAARAALPGGAAAELDGPQRNADIILAQSAIELMQFFATRDDGYLRVMPSSGGKLVYLKWKYTAGRWEGYYGFISGNPYRIIGLLDELREQLEQHATGAKRPSLDRAYNYE